MYKGISKEAVDIVNKSEEDILYRFKALDKTCEYNQYKVLEAMQEFNLSTRHFSESTGYGYDDEGREVCEKIFAKVFGGKSAIVRPQIVSGTHAISIMLYGVLRPGDHILSITGDAYDTIKDTIGVGSRNNNLGSLKDFLVEYSKVELLSSGGIDFEGVKNSIKENTKVVYIQRSTGYDERSALTIEKIKEAVNILREIKEDVIICVDNCYGEFLEKREPLSVGADLIAGSLIKNPGGGLASIGGYVIGNNPTHIEMIASRLTSPGIALEVGANLGVIRSYLQGLFMASTVTTASLKGAILAAKVFSSLGYEVFPGVDEKRSDIVQGIKLGSKEKLRAYCRAIQGASPVDSYVSPEEWDMPGYADKVIMAAGNFIEGSSIELSADGPMKEPFIVYHQGGLTYEHSKIGVMKAVDGVLKVDKETL